jgi:hypothetical protein
MSLSVLGSLFNDTEYALLASACHTLSQTHELGGINRLSFWLPRSSYRVVQGHHEIN